MPSIRDFAQTEQTTSTDTVIVEMPVHEIGDNLIVFANKDTGQPVSDPGAGWTTQAVRTSVAGSSSRLLTKIAASTTETLTLTTPVAETWHVVVISVKDGSIVNAVSALVTTSSIPFSGEPITTTVDNCLVFNALSTDSGIGPTAYPGWINLSNADSSGNSMGVCYTYKKIAGAITAPEWFARVRDGTAAYAIAIQDTGTLEQIPAYTDVDSPATFLIATMQGSATQLGVSFPTLSIGFIGSQTTANDAIGTQGDTGTNPYLASARMSPASGAADKAGTQLGGSEMELASPLDASTGYIVGTNLLATPRDWVELGGAKYGGLQFVVRDGTNYKSFFAGAKNTNSTKADARNIYGCQPNQLTDTVYAESVSFNAANITGFMFLASNKINSVVSFWTHLLHVTEPISIAGGTSTNPLSFEDIDFICNQSNTVFPFSDKKGSALTLYISLSLGGFETIDIDISLKTFQFPKQSDGVKDVSWNLDENLLGFRFQGVDGDDSFNFSNCVFTSESSYYWEFEATTSSLSFYNFKGSTVVNASVVLRPVYIFNQMSFLNCSNFEQNSTEITNSNFLNTTIKATTSSDLDLVTGNTFTLTQTGYAVEIIDPITTQSITWDNILIDYAAIDGSTGNEAILCNVSSGQTLTINVSENGTSPSINNTGAGTIIILENLITLNIKTINGAEVRIKQGSFTLQHNQNVTGEEELYIYTFTPDTKIQISVGKQGFVRQETKYTLTNSNTSLFFYLNPDPSYI